MGEPIYNCPDPTGYRDQAESWMDAGVLPPAGSSPGTWFAARCDGIILGDAFLGRYKAMKPEESEAKMMEDLIGGDVGDRELQP